MKHSSDLDLVQWSPERVVSVEVMLWLRSLAAPLPPDLAYCWATSYAMSETSSEPCGQAAALCQSDLSPLVRQHD